MSDEKKLTTDGQLSEHGKERVELIMDEFRGYSYGDVALFLRLFQHVVLRRMEEKVI